MKRNETKETISFIYPKEKKKKRPGRPSKRYCTILIFTIWMISGSNKKDCLFVLYYSYAQVVISEKLNKSECIFAGSCLSAS